MKAKIRIGTTIVLGVISVVLAINIYGSIMEKHNEISRIKQADQLVIEHLKKIREAQKLYFDGHQQYAPTWDKLTDFIKNGKVYITQTTESITSINGIDSISITIDTLSKAPAIQVLKEKVTISESEINSIGIVPLSMDTFELYTNKLQGVQLVEVSDPAPINPRRQENGDLKPLRIGSKAAATLKGNWE